MFLCAKRKQTNKTFMRYIITLSEMNLGHTISRRKALMQYRNIVNQHGSTCASVVVFITTFVRDCSVVEQ